MVISCDLLLVVVLEVLMAAVVAMVERWKYGRKGVVMVIAATSWSTSITIHCILLLLVL